MGPQVADYDQDVYVIDLLIWLAVAGLLITFGVFLYRDYKDKKDE